MVPGTAECLKRSRRNVEEPLEFLSGGRFKAGHIAAEFIGVENLPHRCLKVRELSGKIRILICGLRKVDQFLPDQIIQSVLDAEALANCACGFALLLPDLVKIHVKLPGGQLYRWAHGSARSGGDLCSPDGYLLCRVRRATHQ